MHVYIQYIHCVHVFAATPQKKMFGNSDNCFSIMWRLKP